MIVLRNKLDGINRKLLTVATDAAVVSGDPQRSPSPEPKHDSSGKQTNSREVRMRLTLERSKHAILDELTKLNPLFKPMNVSPPADFGKQRCSRKLYIPIKEFPAYNFIGLIIGPRGNTQKRMEKETNCRIAIRGRGSAKEGSRGKVRAPDDDDELHVLITGDRQDELEEAAKQVQNLLTPVDDVKNDHKQKQLRELALINGTLRDEDFCHICGEKGHRQWECPNREKSFKTVHVLCTICGDASHPTSDCTQKGKTASEKVAMNADYMDFMSDLGEKPAHGHGTSHHRVSHPLPPTHPTASVSSSSPPSSSSSSAPPALAPWLTQSSHAAMKPKVPTVTANAWAQGAPGTVAVPLVTTQALAPGGVSAYAPPPPPPSSNNATHLTPNQSMHELPSQHSHTHHMTQPHHPPQQPTASGMYPKVYSPLLPQSQPWTQWNNGYAGWSSTYQTYPSTHAASMSQQSMHTPPLPPQQPAVWSHQPLAPTQPQYYPMASASLSAYPSLYPSPSHPQPPMQPQHHPHQPHQPPPPLSTMPSSHPLPANTTNTTFVSAYDQFMSTQS